MRNSHRIIWETRWELNAHLRRCTLPSQRDALRMLLQLRAHGELSDSEVGEVIGRAAHEVWQWWSIYDSDGLAVLLARAESAQWQDVTPVVKSKASDISSRPAGSQLNEPR